MKTKICLGCGEEKSIADFYKASHLKDGLQTRCKKCANTQNVRSMNRKPEKYKAIREKTEQKNKRRFEDWKRSIGCCFCGEDEPVCLDLHHKDPSQKEIGINRLRNYSMDVILEEARKCIMVCSNCHRKIHAGLLDDSDKPLIE